MCCAPATRRNMLHLQGRCKSAPRGRARHQDMWRQERGTPPPLSPRTEPRLVSRAATMTCTRAQDMQPFACARKKDRSQSEAACQHLRASGGRANRERQGASRAGSRRGADERSPASGGVEEEVSLGRRGGDVRVRRLAAERACRQIWASSSSSKISITLSTPTR